ncbi:MAG TPA: Holliday junction branch migration protein RuvA [Acidimicrobiia bacterium]|nr:Holliday junction branch migration protein RuvA [Acidimicrobiia bacterium]
MIGSLRGTVLDRSVGGEVLVEVGGVGYRVAVPSGAVGVLEPGGPVFLFTHLVVREDALSLYGFPEREQRDTFEALMAANGVGPKLALAILSVFTPATLRRAVVEGDVDALTVVPGVGKRTAQRLMIELAAKLGTVAADPAGVGGGPSARAEVRAALEGLGYGPDEVRDVLAPLPDDGPVEVLLKEALKRLAVDRAAPRPVALNGNGAGRA